MAAAFEADHVERVFRVKRLLVRSRGGQRVVNVGDRNNPRGQRDRWSDKTVRISRSVPALMVRSGNFPCHLENRILLGKRYAIRTCPLVEERRALGMRRLTEDSCANLTVRLHDSSFLH